MRDITGFRLAVYENHNPPALAALQRQVKGGFNNTGKRPVEQGATSVSDVDCGQMRDVAAVSGAPDLTS